MGSRKVASIHDTKRGVVPCIRRLARDTSNIGLPDPLKGGPWKEVVTFLQAVRCLQDGDLIEGPDRDDKGNWACTMQRISAGVVVNVSVALVDNGSYLVITNIETR